MTVRVLEFVSRLRGSADEVWAGATDFVGINAELMPWMRMTCPPGQRISVAEVTLGRPLVSSWLLLFGVFPVDRSEVTLVELGPGYRFRERSPMGSMRLWEHVRTVEEIPGGCRCCDILKFEPRVPGPVVPWFVQSLFRHRHARLRARWGGLEDERVIGRKI